MIMMMMIRVEHSVTGMWVGYDWVQGKAGRGTPCFVFNCHDDYDDDDGDEDDGNDYDNDDDDDDGDDEGQLDKGLLDFVLCAFGTQAV